VFVIGLVDGRFPSYQNLRNPEEVEEEHLYLGYPIDIFDRATGMVLGKPSRFVEGFPSSVLGGYAGGGGGAGRSCVRRARNVRAISVLELFVTVRLVALLLVLAAATASPGPRGPRRPTEHARPPRWAPGFPVGRGGFEAPRSPGGPQPRCP
jgi:hypothetical protein